MDTTSEILDSIPLLRHCTDGEIQSLTSLCRISSVKKTQVVDLKKLNALNIIQRGVFELEFSGKRDNVFLTPGSFFGDFPFTDIRNRGSVRAVSDGAIIHLNTDDLYKFLFMNYKVLRGYIRSLENHGMDISSIGKSHFNNKSSIITVFSHVDGSGKSLFASGLALSLSDHGNTVLLDMSYGGKSVFNYLSRKITPPLSQKQEESATPEELISQRLEIISQKLSLLNILYGANIKANTSILSPLLLVLSKTFKYIVIDLSNSDIDIRDGVFNLSDTVFGVLKKRKERNDLEDLFDERLTQGQRAVYILNRHFRDNSPFEGGYTWDDIESVREQTSTDLYDPLKSSISDDIMKIITLPRNALIIPSGFHDFLASSGILLELIRTGISFNVYYTSFMGFSSLAAYLNTSEEEEYKKTILKYYSEEIIKSQLDITFPREHVFKNSRIKKIANELAHGARIEYFRISPMLAIGRIDSTRRIFSTGKLSDLITASRVIYPLFEESSIGGDKYESGYPRTMSRVEDLYRMDTSMTVVASTRFRNDPGIGVGILPFYEKFLNRYNDYHARPYSASITEKEFVIDVSDELDDPQKMLELAGKAANKFLKENNFI